MDKAHGLCRLCLKDCEFVESHLIQKALYKDPLDKTSRIEHIYSEEKKEKRLSRGGIYGRFLCAECEAKFNLWDDKGYKLLFKEQHKLIMITDPLLKDKAFIVSEISKCKKYNNKELLKLYFISILWRASVSDREEFAAVKLGDKFEYKARLAILNNDSAYFQEFDVCLSKFSDGIAGFMMPTKQKYTNGVNGYRLVLPYFSCFIKIDKRPFPSNFVGISMNTSSSVMILHRNWKRSKEKKAMLDIIKKVGVKSKNKKFST